ncbi:hypothetical protein SAMN05660748_0556 [Blastococcus aggregatus]|uniref:Uncharacterized protein n=1 Tax=Blastococcus aggregatus TaxID=38502 RepID=A0A285UYS6_9ACTN|nr:hypothetical protein [Blastococcus aggregatus]SOC46979.1 hypothetical protein SAMN05660748_0556 [Blastococcus aggregatus]
MTQPPPAAASPDPAPGGWPAATQPSWAPAWQPPAPVPSAGAPVGASPRSRGPLVAAAAGGLLAGLLASGLVVVALFTASAEDIGATMADRIGTAVEEGIVDGTRIATEESLEGLGGYEEDLLDPGGWGQPPEQFPPVPPREAGPDPVLDAYAQDCFAGDLQACDDLLFESPPLSDYEEYGGSCGGRVKAYTVGSCTELE